MSNLFSIGIVTYIRRYDSYFKPLIKQLDLLFPHVEKTVVVNGFYDQEAQAKYLQEITEFLRHTTVTNLIKYQDNQSLAKCWNQLILHSHSHKILILNDDTFVTWPFQYFVRAGMLLYDNSVINNSWSHFWLSKNTVRQNGWFEERLPAVGLEDADYGLRLALAKGQKIMPKHHQHNWYSLGIKNVVAKNTDPGWSKSSHTINNKYAQANSDFFAQKWEKSKTNLQGGMYCFNDSFYRIRPGMETPLFYDLSLLDHPLNSPI